VKRLLSHDHRLVALRSQRRKTLNRADLVDDFGGLDAAARMERATDVQRDSDTAGRAWSGVKYAAF